MQPRNQPIRKAKDKPGGRPKALLSVRSAFVLTVAVLAGLGGAGLFYAAHRPVALIVLGAVGIFAAALKLLDSLIELGPLWFLIRLEVRDSLLGAVQPQLREHGRPAALSRSR